MSLSKEERIKLAPYPKTVLEAFESEFGELDYSIETFTMTGHGLGYDIYVKSGNEYTQIFINVDSCDMMVQLGAGHDHFRTFDYGDENESKALMEATAHAMDYLKKVISGEIVQLVHFERGKWWLSGARPIEDLDTENIVFNAPVDPSLEEQEIHYRFVQKEQ